jgi:hypothetical protein
MSAPQRKTVSQILKQLYPESNVKEGKYTIRYIPNEEIYDRISIEKKTCEEVMIEVGKEISTKTSWDELTEDLGIDEKTVEPLKEFLRKNKAIISLRPKLVLNEKKSNTSSKKKDKDKDVKKVNPIIKKIKEKLALPREVLPQYKLKEKYYVSNYIKDIHGQIFTGETKEEVDAQVEEYVFSRLQKVCRKIIGTNMYIVLKVNAKELREKAILPKGIYSGDYDGIYMTKVGDEDIQYHNPFELLFLETRLTSSDIVCEPFHEHEKHTIDNEVFNVFPGFKAQYEEEMTCEEAKSICQPILDHIKEILANGNEEIYNNIFECIANIIRNPKAKNETMPTIIGPQGVGKGLLFESFLQPFVFGIELMAIVSGLDKLTEEFNGILEGKLLVLVDESASFEKSGLGKKDMETLKQYITGRTITIRKMHKNRIEVNNYLNFLHITNTEDGGLYLEGRARRFNLFHTTDVIRPDNYFDDFIKKNFNQKVANAFFTYCIKSKPLCSTKKIIETKERTFAIENSKAAGLLFFDQVFKTGEYAISSSLIKNVNGTIYVTKEDLYQRYKLWWNETKNGTFWSKRSFDNRCNEVPYLTISKVQDKHVIPVRSVCVEVTEVMYEKIMLEDGISLYQYLYLKEKGSLDNEKEIPTTVETVKKSTQTLVVKSKKNKTKKE